MSVSPYVWVGLLAGVATSAMAVAMLVLFRGLVRPARSLARTAEALARGNWDARSAATGASDMNVLGDRLNALARTARLQLDELNHQRADLASLVDALPDPILLVDENERVGLVNAPAARLLQLPPDRVIGQRFVSVVTDAAILELYEDTLDHVADPGYTKHREIKLIRDTQRISYQAVAKRTQTGGTLIVLRDISTLVGAVQMKTDFVANASHELRTPISAIKVAFETLTTVYQEDPPLAERCMTIIGGQVQRLEDMLRDLLDLSRVESADLKPTLVPLRSGDIFALVASTWAGIAGEKGVRLEFPPQPENDDDADIDFISDRRLLDLILKNLVENAIKFTPAGGVVRLGFLRSEGEVRISVSDTGIGIPPEHLERVFERFYQVDSARSGSAGRGTGLGLAIVKHAVHALGGQVRLQSQVGKGTTVTCILPQTLALKPAA